MSDNQSCKECRAHSGIYREIKHIEKANEDQRKEINTMKKWLIGILTSSILTLIGTVVMLVAKAAGKSP